MLTHVTLLPRAYKVNVWLLESSYFQIASRGCTISSILQQSLDYVFSHPSRQWSHNWVSLGNLKQLKKKDSGYCRQYNLEKVQPVIQGTS